MTKIQTTGSYDRKSGDFSISICPNDNHLFTLDGLSIDDMKELKSLVDILLESYEDAIPKAEDIMPPWGHSDMEALCYTEEELNAMCDKVASDQEKEKCREYNLREAEYYDNRVKLDNKFEEELRKNGYDWTPLMTEKVKKWVLSTEVDGMSGEVIVSLPDDLLEATNLKEGDQVEWIDNGDGTYAMKKVTKPLLMEEC